MHGTRNDIVAALFVPLVILFLATYVASPWPKVFGLCAIASALLSAARGLRFGHHWLLFAIPMYIYLITVMWTWSGVGSELSAIQQPLYVWVSLAVILLFFHQATLVLQLGALFAVLAVGASGVVGELAGNDMTQYLPFEMPQATYFENVRNYGEQQRLRGFQAEAGVLSGSTACIWMFLLGAGTLLIKYSRFTTTGWVVIIVSTLLAVPVLVVTATKTGVAVLVVAASVFVVLHVFHTPHAIVGRAMSVSLFGAIVVAAVIMILPEKTAVFLHEETQRIADLVRLGRTSVSDVSGLETRIQCWQLALSVPLHYPFGLGLYGLGEVSFRLLPQELTPELKSLFERDVFGLKNALANLLSESGIVGIVALSAWLVAQTRRIITGTGALPREIRKAVFNAYLVMMSSVLALAATCELYPILGLMLTCALFCEAVCEVLIVSNEHTV